jgi:diadenylate cyclase
VKRTDCELSPDMKNQLKEHLQQIAIEINQSLEALDDDSHCLLCDFEEIREKFTDIESTAASYYLKSYLSPFTDKYLDLSISIQHLSERRHGALIVVERNDMSEEWLQPGIPVEAAFTYSLLESIFYPGNPLHDGAVIIRENRLISAANVLPLSNQNTGEKKLGTRHRAALGLSEQSDALVIVISEETGKASFAMDGILYPISTVGTHY